MGLEEPGLDHVSRSYHDEGGETVHVREGNGSRDAREQEQCYGDVSKADAHQ